MKQIHLKSDTGSAAVPHFAIADAPIPARKPFRVMPFCRFVLLIIFLITSDLA